ncbi:MAG: alpha-N-acetylglucosaminidase C-terminal domain-containing protein, partial [Bacteroidaceae bacterium]|nr:alpha-N-acetylglucosaminidase C-terminal domain-containing protein [Bacteroidaceae bacterium]
WDEDRWMKEIDWMALHGVNLPLQIVGIDAVWYQMLRNEFGYNHDQATEFVAGPFYQSWWLMNNLQGESGPNPQWWYNRQAALGRKITDRMRELGMTPCLPGFVGMAPEKFVTDRGIDSYSGKWSNYTCPKVINAATETGAAAFRELGEKYYDYIRNVYGFMPKSFSLDPFHERSNPAGVDGYKKICDLARDVMNAASPNAMWVAQEWQNNAEQSRIDALPTENTLLLDLSSERQTFYSRFGNHEYAFCMLHNYGGNVGLYGCIDQLMNNYFDTHRNHATLKGIGANPEGLETNPVMYELLFEMPWLGSKPVAKTWLATYAANRYNLKNNTDKQYVSQAWENLLSTVYNQNFSTQQGCAEPLVCIRPTKFFVQGKTDVSSWAQAQRNWDKDVMVAAAKKLLKANAINKNYLYDLVDVVRQALADKAHTLLTELKELKDAGQSSSTTFTDKRDDFMCIIDDTDLLLSYIPNFTMQRWVTMARNIAKQNGGSTAEEDWMERYARQLVTTWRPDDSSLMDYANREWAGLVKDYYKARWSYYFSSGAAVTEEDLFNNVEQKYVLGTLDGTAYGKYTQTGTANETYAADEIKALATKLLQDHTGDLGSDDDETPVQFSGDGKTHVIQPSEIGWKGNAIQATDKWEIDIAATDTGEYNWTGGVILASGENPFAANTQGGFRLRQNASEATGSDGRFCYTNGSDNQFRRTNGRNFIIKMMYDGSQTIVTATIDGETETRTFTNTYGEISAFSYALPVGFNINSLTITPVHDTFPMNGKYCRIRSVKSRNVGKVWQAEPTATAATAAAEPHLSTDTNIRLADNTYDPNSIWAFEAKGAGFLLRHANSQALANNLTHAAKETKVALDASEKNAGLFSFHDQERQDEGKWVYMLRYDTDEGYFSGRYVNKGSFGDNMTWWNGDQSTGANDFVFDEV